MISYKRNEERERIGSDLSDKPFSEFELFDAIDTDMEFQKAFEQMQRIYVFQNDDMLDFGAVTRSISRLYEILLSLDEKLSFDIAPSDEFVLKL